MKRPLQRCTKATMFVPRTISRPFYLFTLLVAIDFRHPFVACTILPLANISLESINGYTPAYDPNRSAPIKPTATTLLTSQPQQQTNANSNVQKNAISDLTRDLNLQLKSIVDHELLIPAIQNAFNAFERSGSASSEHNDTKVLNTIATKIEAKLSHGIRILNETIQKFLTILSEKSTNHNQPTQKLQLDAIILPCSAKPIAKHTERSANENKNADFEFIGGINKKKAIEVLNFLKNAGHLHETDDRNFTINKRLMETLKSINLFAATPTNNNNNNNNNNVPIFRDVFFLPRHSQISSTHCHNTLPNEHHRYRAVQSLSNFVCIFMFPTHIFVCFVALGFCMHHR